MYRCEGEKRFVAYFKALLSCLGHAVAQLVEALHYKPGGGGFDSSNYNRRVLIYDPPFFRKYFKMALRASLLCIYIT